MMIPLFFPLGDSPSVALQLLIFLLKCYRLELGRREKVAERGVADFSHPA
jgi:hypothetical protein